MYPETTFEYQGQKFIVWATSKSSLGFKTHPDWDSPLEASPLKVNSVDYRVRFTASLESGKWSLYGQKNGRNSVTYWNTVFIKRTKSTLAGSDPTESARDKITALAHEVITAFVATDAADELLRDGRAARALFDLETTFKKLGEAREALQVASTAFRDAAAEAQLAGIDPNSHLDKIVNK